MCIHIYVCVFLWICAYACILHVMCMWVGVNVLVHVYVYVYMYAHVHVYAYVYVHSCACVSFADILLENFKFHWLSTNKQTAIPLKDLCKIPCSTVWHKTELASLYVVGSQEANFFLGFCRFWSQTSK